MNYLAQLRHHAAAASRPAIVTDDGELGYPELLARVLEAASALQAAGIAPGSRVGLMIANETEHLVASLALLAIGARHITLATHDSASLRATIARRVAATVVIVAGDHELPDGVRPVSWPPAPVSTPCEPAPDGEVLLKTSGTTGDMNIVVFSGAMLSAQAGRHPEYADERLLRLAAIEHNNSKRHRLYCVWQGGTNIFRSAGTIDIPAFCRRHRVTCLDISRMHASDLAAQGSATALAGVRLRTGGSAVPVDVRRSIEERVTRQLYVRYAATECGAIAMAGPGEHDDDESVGRPLPGVELEIVDDEDQRLATGETGHIRLRAPGMATGYLDGGEQTAARFRDGWFHPGDMGVLRADGHLVVKGRRDDMMVLNGLNIFPAEIERVLERHPDVAVAAALALESRVHGQIPVAAVELREGASVTAAELQAYGREHLALRAPRRIVIMGALPRNSQGKLLRRELLPLFRIVGTGRD